MAAGIGDGARGVPVLARSNIQFIRDVLAVHIVHAIPASDTQVMLTTPHDYMSSAKSPKVEWARQVAPVAMGEQEMGIYGRWGLHFVRGLDSAGYRPSISIEGMPPGATSGCWRCKGGSGGVSNNTRK